jgi:hypothetical protein
MKIHTKKFRRLVEMAKKLNRNTPLSQIRGVHRQIELEVIKYHRNASGLKMGVILDPGALGIDIAHLQSAFMPNMAFGGGGQVIKKLAHPSEAGTVPGSTQFPGQAPPKIVDTHYHHGGYAAATHQVLPEAKNIIKNDRPKERIQLLRGRTKRFRVHNEPKRRYLFQDKRRPMIPRGLHIKSQKC